MPRSQARSRRWPEQPEITVVELMPNGDWQAIYIDGQLVRSGENLGMFDLAAALGIELRGADTDHINFPQRLEDLESLED